jgi:hypothetical protein
VTIEPDEKEREQLNHCRQNRITAVQFACGRLLVFDVPVVFSTSVFTVVGIMAVKHSVRSISDTCIVM